MNAITTHVLDATVGKPAAGVAITLEQRIDEAWVVKASSATDADGRCRDLVPSADDGVYRLTFATGDYLAQNGRTSIYPVVSITFTCRGDAHYHLPILLSDNSFTTYRGS
jgi:5-hydroxyisourate hydrolase